MSQRTTNYRFDDNNDDDAYALTALVFHLQNTVEQLQQHFNDSLEKLENTMKEKISTLEQSMICIVVIDSRSIYILQ